MIESIPEEALVSPATQIFANDLYLEAFRYELGEWIAGVCRPLAPFMASEWTQFGLGLLALALGAHVCRRVVSSMCPGRSTWRLILCLWFCAATYIGFTKIGSILSKSSSDEGSTLVEVMAGETNGYSCVIAKATGLEPAPMWYRTAASNEWTLATDDGWSLTSAAHEGDFYTYEWHNADTNDSVTAWNMWYFGQNPPAVELTVTGGVNLVGAVFSGRLVKFTWQIDEDVPLKPGSRLIIQNMDFSDNLPMWNEIVADESPTTNLTETAVYGFWLDRKTAWRLRLEVPQ